MDNDEKTSPTWHVLDRTDAYRQEVQLFPNGTLVLQKVFTKATGEEWDREGLTYLTPAAVAALRVLLGAPFQYAVGQAVTCGDRSFTYIIAARRYQEGSAAPFVEYLLANARRIPAFWAYESDLEPIEEDTP